MNIEQHTPPTPQFALTFTQEEGWAIVAALRQCLLDHPGAVHGQQWRRWAAALDEALVRRA